MADSSRLDQEFEELIEFIFECERGERLLDRIDLAVGAMPPVVASHSCRPPTEELLPWKCDTCGQMWRRELGGGWVTQ